MDKVNPFPAFTEPFPIIFISNLSNTEEVDSVSNLGKISLAKGKNGLIVLFYLNLLITLPNVFPINPPNILDNSA